MSGITSAVGAMGSFFADNPAIKAIQQAQERTEAQPASQTAGVAGIAGAAGVVPVSPAPATDASALEARIAALESGGAPSSMSPGALAAGEAMYGSQDSRNRSIDPNIFNRR